MKVSLLCISLVLIIGVTTSFRFTQQRRLSTILQAKPPSYEKNINAAKLDDEERLQKIISRAGIASRRNAEKLILDGRVTVNGKMVSEVGTKVNMKSDVVAVDGTRVKLPDAKKIFWVVVYKPRSVLTTTSDDKDRETVMDIVPQAKELRLLPIGRLERDTTGVMILTNENGWIHPLTHPSFIISKKFQVVVQGIPSEALLEEVSSDFTLFDGTKLKGCDIKVVEVDRRANMCMFDVKIEDTNPLALQLIMDHIGCPIVSIKRTAFGPIELKGLKKGSWREMSPTEIQTLKESVKEAPKSDQPASSSIKQKSYYSSSSSSSSSSSKTDGSSRNNRFSSSSSRRKNDRIPMIGGKRPGSGYFKRTIGRNQSFNNNNKNDKYNNNKSSMRNTNDSTKNNVNPYPRPSFSNNMRASNNNDNNNNNNNNDDNESKNSRTSISSGRSSNNDDNNQVSSTAKIYTRSSSSSSSSSSTTTTRNSMSPLSKSRDNSKNIEKEFDNDFENISSDDKIFKLKRERSPRRTNR